MVPTSEEDPMDLDSPSPTPETSDLMEIPQSSTMLNLPLEVFQTITYHMDVATFYASLLTCKHFLHAAESRRNLLHHLYRIPGLKLGLEDQPTPSLLMQFRKRAAESACAAGVLADVTVYEQTGRRSLSCAAFSPANRSKKNSQPFIATVHDGGIIHIYDLGNSHVRLKTELHIRPEDGNNSRMEIIQLAFSPRSRDLAVLYRHCQPPKKKSLEGAIFGRKSYDSDIYKLVMFHYCFASSKGHFYDSHEQDTRDVKLCGLELPVGLALASNGTACIAIKNMIGEDTNLMLVGRDDKLMEACHYDEDPRILRNVVDAKLMDRYKGRPIHDVQFVCNDRKINLYGLGHPIHGWFTTTTDPSEDEFTPPWSNSGLVHLESMKPVIHVDYFAVGMPFHATHYDQVDVSWQSALVCWTSYLALGYGKSHSQGSGDGHPDAYILQAETPVINSCDHRVNLDDGRTLGTWKAVALLAGWRQGTSSLGTILAISPEGTKIAAATWNRVLVWSLHPKLLHQGELQHYFSVRDYNTRKAFGRIRPTLLSSEGVVHKMLWTDETCLYATTDKGLINWDMGHLSDGERDDLKLAYDAWPNTAIALPAVGIRRPQLRTGMMI